MSKVLEFRLQHSPSNEYSGLISFRIDWFDLAVQGRDSQESSPASQFKGVNSSVLSLLYGPVLTWDQNITGREDSPSWPSSPFVGICPQNVPSAALIPLGPQFQGPRESPFLLQLRKPDPQQTQWEQWLHFCRGAVNNTTITSASVVLSVHSQLEGATWF